MPQFAKEFGNLRKVMLQIWLYLKVSMNLMIKISCEDGLDLRCRSLRNQLDLYKTNVSHITNKLKIDEMSWLWVMITWNGLKRIAKMNSVFSIKAKLGFQRIWPALKFSENLVISKVKKYYSALRETGNSHIMTCWFEKCWLLEGCMPLFRGSK